MGTIILQCVFILVLAGCTVVISVDGNPNPGQNNRVKEKPIPWPDDMDNGNPNSGKKSKAKVLDVVLHHVYNFMCKYLALFPKFVRHLPLKLESVRNTLLIQENPPASCINLELEAVYKWNPKNLKRELRQRKLPVVWVIGGPGSGKGTMCKAYTQGKGFAHISVGDCIRSEVSKAPNSLNAQLLQLTMKRGDLLPFSVTLAFLGEAMMSKLNSKGFLIDGFPRSLDQAKAFQRGIKHPDVIVTLKVSDKTMKERALNRNEGRADDNEATFNQRLELFHKQQKTIINNRMFAPKVIEVDVEGKKEENVERFTKAVDEALERLKQTQ